MPQAVLSPTSPLDPLAARELRQRGEPEWLAAPIAACDPRELAAGGMRHH